MSTTIDVLLPVDQAEGTRSQVLRWLKTVGESVKRHEPLVEIETDKVTVEVPAPADGILQEITVVEGVDVEPGALLGRVAPAAAGSGVPAAAPAGAAASKSAPESPAVAARARRGTPDRMSPAVRRLLAEHGLDADTISGSGAGGRITVDDVLAVAARPAAPAANVATPAVDKGPDGIRRVPHTPMRRRIAAHMVESLLQTAPHVTTMFEADLAAVLAHRAAQRQDFERRGAALTLTAYFVAACVDALRAVPEANARWTDDALLLNEQIDIGVAAALEGRGLVVPVIRNVAALDLFGIAAALAELITRARADRLTPADLQGGTFTISNHGVSGSLMAAPIIINQPQSAILGIGRFEKRAVVVERDGRDEVVICPRCYLTLTIDHRVLDGHQANRFLEVLVGRLEGWS
ncbi:MAG: 2-oxo acid dehydrogenase subunit E2 [Gammaproteobacteria bacterium]|nr:2-oxo acid dehydrogenase subunit E2 [Gammaproteobacteria bacterium]